MKYYVTADVHGYFSELKTALAEKGFFEDTHPHKLIVCGDLYDRGKEAAKLQEFILDLMALYAVIGTVPLVMQTTNTTAANLITTQTLTHTMATALSPWMPPRPFPAK